MDRAGGCERATYQTLKWDEIAFFNCLDLYHRSPDSGERQYKSRT